MWTWDQSSGCMTATNGSKYYGYSGNGRGKNNPSMQAAKGIGPIPQGDWAITSVRDSPNTGPFTITLIARPDTKTLGRDDFRIHGDSVKNPGTASHGCIILPRKVRELIWKSGDRLVRVIE